jgi:hypothetical protein
MHGHCHQSWVTHVGAMTGDIQDAQMTVAQLLMQVFPNRQRRQSISAVLQDQAWRSAVL